MASFKIQQAEVDNGIFEILRLKCVELGYLPDFVVSGNITNYNTAKNAIRQTGKQIIEVFNNSTGSSIGEQNINNIIVKRKTTKPAKTGVGKSYEYELDSQNNNYKKTETADTKYDILYTITYNTTSAEYSDIIEEILRDCFGIRKLINALDNNAIIKGEFWLIYTGEADTSMASFIEKKINYEARNIDLIGDIDLGTVASLETFTLDISTDIENIDVTIEDENNDFSIDIDIS